MGDDRMMAYRIHKAMVVDGMVDDMVDDSDMALVSLLQAFSRLVFSPRALPHLVSSLRVSFLRVSCPSCGDLVI